MLTCTKTELKDLNKLVEENLPLVGYVISKYYPSIVGTPEYDDYFQSGAVGLVIAAKKFNPRLGYAFSTYAVPTIHGYMRRQFWDYEMARIKAPREKRVLFIQIYNLQNRGLSEEEICSILDIPLEKYLETVNLFSYVPSLNQAIPSEESDSDMFLEDIVANKEDVEKMVERKMEFHSKMELLKSVLTKKEEMILEMYYVRDMKQKEIADIFGCAQSYISYLARQVKRKALLVSKYYDGKLTYEKFLEEAKKNPPRKKTQNPTGA